MENRHLSICYNKFRPLSLPAWWPRALIKHVVVGVPLARVLFLLVNPTEQLTFGTSWTSRTSGQCITLSGRWVFRRWSSTKTIKISWQLVVKRVLYISWNFLSPWWEKSATKTRQWTNSGTGKLKALNISRKDFKNDLKSHNSWGPSKNKRKDRGLRRSRRRRRKRTKRRPLIRSMRNLRRHF